MKQKLKLPAGFGFPVWPYKIDSDKIFKAEAKCLIWSEQLEDGTSAVMKMYYRRGLANFIRGIILNFRVKREYRILKHLAGCGVLCTIPFFWTFGYCKEYVICSKANPTRNINRFYNHDDQYKKIFLNLKAIINE